MSGPAKGRRLALPAAPLGAPWDDFPQELADEVTRLAQEAVRWFRDPGHVFLGDPSVPRQLSDDEVRERIAGFQRAVDGEVWRLRNVVGLDIEAYQLAELPFARQRALVERWERAWLEFYGEEVTR